MPDIDPTLSVRNWTRSDTLIVTAILAILATPPFWYIFFVHSYLARRFENDIQLLNSIGLFLGSFASMCACYAIETYIYRKAYRDNWSDIQHDRIPLPRNCENGVILKGFWMIPIPLFGWAVVEALQWYTFR